MKFIRKDAHKKARVSSVWRKPKGIQNKMRLRKQGHPAVVKPGYGKPVKNLYKGLKIVDVSSLEELKKLDPKKEAANLTKTSKKNKVVLVEHAHKNKITLVNLNAESYLKAVEEFLKQKKEKKSIVKKRKDKLDKKTKDDKKEEPKETKKEETKKETKQEVDPEKKKEQEKKEKDKVLTKK